MMRNDLPYAPPVNGRWYKIFLENDNGNIKKTSSDINITLTESVDSIGIYIEDNNYHLLTFIIDAKVTNIYCEIKQIFARNKQGILFSNKNAIDNITLYVYLKRC